MVTMVVIVLVMMVTYSNSFIEKTIVVTPFLMCVCVCLCVPEQNGLSSNHRTLLLCLPASQQQQQQHRLLSCS